MVLLAPPFLVTVRTLTRVTFPSFLHVSICIEVHGLALRYQNVLAWVWGMPTLFIIIRASFFAGMSSLSV